MEAVGAISGLLAIITAALQASCAISNFISQVKGAPQNVRQLGQELRDLEIIFAQIDQTSIGHTGVIYSVAIEVSLRSCCDELKRLQGLLESLVPKPPKVKSGIRQRTLYGIKKFLKDDDIREAVNALQSRKLSLCLALMTDLTRFVMFIGGCSGPVLTVYAVRKRVIPSGE